MSGARVGHRLLFGDLQSNGIEFGPIAPLPSDAPPYDLFDCPLTVTVDREAIALWPRGGMEPYALANLRSNLSSMIAAGRGTFWFGDHDFAMLVEVTCAGDDTAAALTLDLPPVDRWDIRLPDLSVQEMKDLIATIDEIEEELGPLTGACGACGVKEPLFHPEPYLRQG